MNESAAEKAPDSEAATPAVMVPPDLDGLTEQIIAQLKTVYDPEIPVDIFELGLIYKIDLDEPTMGVDIDMTLTAPACPVAGEMPVWVKEAVERVPGLGAVKVNMVFDPPWDPSRMSDEAKLELNMF